MVFTDETTISRVLLGASAFTGCPKDTHGVPCLCSRRPRSVGGVHLWPGLPSPHGILAWSLFYADQQILLGAFEDQAESWSVQRSTLGRATGFCSRTMHQPTLPIVLSIYSRKLVRAVGSLLCHGQHTLPISLRENLWARIKDELSRNSPPPNTAALNERVAELID